ncbi:TetR/AcrR family transcriptional regulator [Clostridium sp. P21]|uniref:TetR/AcrR family transcriptional regulator n=1 Tax=Clostridium muellerianum TaxID=2716538 RepID=A0A7Y0EH33_9CLOT|nr:TetR/AcrR family transcriptional regulator [Clostridium muellerianum]NMM63341.1 TetR/AcrR family transcriptional regulator [Clostridium muellerianum]
MSKNNIEKNTYAKNQIISATIKLLEKTELNKIAISEISKHAMVSRVSIYRNFPDKESIVKSYIEQIISNWKADYRDTSKKVDEDKMLAHLFGHIKDNASFYLLLKDRNLIFLLREVLKDICGPKPESPNFDSYLAAFIFSGIYGWIEEWIERGMSESAETMEALLKAREIK